MSAIRLLSLLVLAALSCVCLLSVSVSGLARPADPTTMCYAPLGGPTVGSWLGDEGYYDLYGLESYSSGDYLILCAFRALYKYGPGATTDVYGPWHGNSTMNPDDCFDFVSTLGSTRWIAAGAGSYTTRTNGATGNTVMVAFSLGDACAENYICAGAGCPGSTNAAAARAALAADPTVRTTNFTTSSSAHSSGNTQVITTINATASTNMKIQDPSGSYPTKVVSVVTSVQLCFGYVAVSC